jgi:hypothetical protein
MVSSLSKCCILLKRWQLMIVISKALRFI